MGKCRKTENCARFNKNVKCLRIKKYILKNLLQKIIITEEINKKILPLLL
jgi:hypothetical protein